MDAPISSAAPAVRDVLGQPIRSCGRCCQLSKMCARTVSRSRRTMLSGKRRSESADWIETSLDAYRDVRDHSSETLFHAIYGSPIVQAIVGLKASDAVSAPQARHGRCTPHFGGATD